MTHPLSVLEEKLWRDGIISDSKHLAHAANCSGGPNACVQSGLRLDVRGANVLDRTSQ